MKLFKNAILIVCLAFITYQAHAATIAITQGTGTNMLTKQDGSGNNASSITLCDATTPGNCAPIGTSTGLTATMVDSGGTTMTDSTNHALKVVSALTTATKVQGFDASGGAATTNPVVGAGIDGSSLVQPHLDVFNGINSTGSGFQGVGLVGQWDDAYTAPNTADNFYNLRTDKSRRLLVDIGESEANRWTKTGTLTDGTAATIHASCGSGLKNYIDWFSWSSLATTTAVEIDVNDSLSPTTIYADQIAAGAGGRSASFGQTPIPQTNAAQAVSVKLSGSPTGNVTYNAGGHCGQ